MRIEKWEESIQAFVRCVQQDMEIGEAWANIGNQSVIMFFFVLSSSIFIFCRCNIYEIKSLE
jgi:hypothetical protein